MPILTPQHIHIRYCTIIVHLLTVFTLQVDRYTVLCVCVYVYE